MYINKLIIILSRKTIPKERKKIGNNLNNNIERKEENSSSKKHNQSENSLNVGTNNRTIDNFFLFFYHWMIEKRKKEREKKKQLWVEHMPMHISYWRIPDIHWWSPSIQIIYLYTGDSSNIINHVHCTKWLFYFVTIVI
mgnify:CR=1 FL=1